MSSPILLLLRELLLFFVPLIFRRETVLFSVWSIKRGGRDPIRPNCFSAVGPTTVLLVFPPSASSLSRRQNCLPLSIHVIESAVDVRGETLRKTVYLGLLKIAMVLSFDKGESFEKPDCVAIKEFFFASQPPLPLMHSGRDNTFVISAANDAAGKKQNLPPRVDALCGKTNKY